MCFEADLNTHNYDHFVDYIVVIALNNLASESVFFSICNCVPRLPLICYIFHVFSLCYTWQRLQSPTVPLHLDDVGLMFGVIPYRYITTAALEPSSCTDGYVQ